MSLFDLTDVARGAADYYLGRENIQDVQQLGREQQAALTGLAGQVGEAAQFKPYTVTGTLADVSATPEGGLTVGLSPEQQALQSQLMGQAAGLFGQVGQDPAAQQAAIFEQIRATQRPEEERQRLALEERMLSQGRLGLSSAAYGGSSPELLAQETARQEAMSRASLGARQQALAEQQQSLAGAQGLLGAGYMPQQQALGLFGAAATPAGYADVGRRTGAQYQAELGLGGVEARTQAEDLANQLRLQQQRSLFDSLLGREATLQEQLVAGVLKDPSIAAGQDGIFSNVFSGAQDYLSNLPVIGGMFGGGGTSSGGAMVNPILGGTVGGGMANTLLTNSPAASNMLLQGAIPIGSSLGNTDSDGDGVFDWLDSTPNDPARF